MRFVVTQRFRRDFARLSASEKSQFRAAVRNFSEACDRFVVDRAADWPSTLRIKSIRNAPGIWEMTWSFAGPDGRATWEWVTVDVEIDGRVEALPAVRWRRIGGHAIFREP